MAKCSPKNSPVAAHGSLWHTAFPAELRGLQMRLKLLPADFIAMMVERKTPELTSQK